MLVAFILAGMMDAILHLVDILFFVFHILLILFNIFGWLVPRWRLLNLFTLSFTAFSWFIVGIWYGWGYCFCTDWHWEIRKLLGYHDMPNSYIHFLIIKLTGFNLPAIWVDLGTLILFFSSFVTSIILNLKSWKTRPGRKIHSDNIKTGKIR